ncbi:MAG: capsular polysaccharide biosynthesis protein [Pseudomonadota bacterium]
MNPASGPPRLLAAYTGGFLFDRRIRRILELAGWRVAPALRPSRAEAVAVWGRRPVSARGLAVARWTDRPVLNVEDAFLRSLRPGAAGDPPLGLLLDLQGLHYDPAQPSALEDLLQNGQFDTARAAAGIAFLRQHGLSKFSDWDPGASPPAPGYVLIVDQTAGDAAIAASGCDPATFVRMLAEARAAHPGARIVIKTHPVTAAGHRRGHFGPEDAGAGAEICAAPVNPWALLAGATAVYTVSSQMGFEAILAGHRPVVYGRPFYAGWGLSEDRQAQPRRTRRLTREELFAGAMVDYPVWYDPHRDALCDFETVAQALSAQARAWREDRAPLLCAGMRPWKHAPMRAFLRHSPDLRFCEEPAAALRQAVAEKRRLLLWAGRETPEITENAASAQLPLMRVEDGFLRSVGLGARLLPAASLVFDDLGIYFDPGRESRLEALINASETLTKADRARADGLAKAVVAAGVTKYNVGTGGVEAPKGRLCVLVPGQVEDDASIRLGTDAVRTNAALLDHARAVFPDAFLVYKPHPDVEAGLRVGAVPGANRVADLVAHEVSAAEALAAADVVVTMTSLMGFEALIRGKRVHCLGMPFYAGWGLTEDHGQNAPRRVARPDLTALVHAALIGYPRYFDAETGLACAPEAVLYRLATRSAGVSRHAAGRHRLLAVAQDRLRRFAPLWRR